VQRVLELMACEEVGGVVGIQCCIDDMVKLGGGRHFQHGMCFLTAF